MNFEVNFVLPHWLYWSFLLIGPLVAIYLVQRSFRRGQTPTGVTAEEAAPVGTGETLPAPGNAFTRYVDTISGFTGRFVGYWALIAPFIYTYEVIARYLLNSPTNWAHESMFLMFGMQYLLAGAYALREDGHVRVDVLYTRLSPLLRAALDLLTSVFFYIFTLALITTGWTFFAQSMSSEQFFFAAGYRNELSFTEWAIQYYPVKFTIFLGGVLLLLQGTARLIKDIQAYRLASNAHRSNSTAAGVLSGVDVNIEQPPGLTAARILVGIGALLALLILVEIVNIAVFEGDSPLWTLESSLSGFGIGALTAVMFGSLLVVLLAGLPLAFVTGGLGVLFLFLIGDHYMLNLIPSRIFPLMTNYQLSAIPLFIFMAAVLEKAGLIEELFDVVYKWLGGLRGGLAVATIFASTILAAMVGVIGAAVVTMGMIALPAMLRRRYDPQIAMGSIMAGGTLGILIPPSILAILYGVVAQQSVGELYIGSVIPGLLLSSMYMLYVWIRSTLNPTVGPPLPVAERVSTAEKLRLLRSMLAPVALVILVLGVIFTGMATAVEAAGIGSFGALLVAALHGRLTWPNLHAACMTTLKATAMVLWIAFGASIFVGFYILQGGQEFVQESIEGFGLGPYGILALMMIILIFLGMFLDWVGILLLAVPIFVPLIMPLEFDGVFGLPGVSPANVGLWFGVVYLVNMQMSFLSPPFGYALFYIRGVAPASIPMAAIFRSAIPFLVLQLVGLTLVIIFPDLITWLPNRVYGGD